MADIIKTLVVSVYYLIYLSMDVWVNMWFFCFLGIAALTGIVLAGKKKEIGRKYLYTLIGGAVILYIPVVVHVFRAGTLGKYFDKGILSWIYYLIAFIFVLQTSNLIWTNIVFSKQKDYGQNNTAIYKKIRITIQFLWTAGLIPVLMISPYIFPRADDYSFGYHCHLAWTRTGSFLEVLKAAVVMIDEAYFDWQGTYSSIFMMAMQPAVFDESFYRIVPIFFMVIITGSSYFFLKTVLIDWLKADDEISKVCIWVYILLVTQCVPVIQSAYFWYNGAVHYIASHCMELCFMAFLIRLYLGKRKWTDYAGCIISAIYTGGGNLVTAIGTLLLTLTIGVLILITKTWKKNKVFLIMCFVYWCALAVNIAAPGNYSRLGNSSSMGIPAAFVKAFISSAGKLFGEWMHWTVIMTIVLLLPFLWKVAAQIKFTFPCPVIAVGYSWGYLASLFFSPLFAAGRVDAGRYENVMFLQAIMLLLFDITYVMGWLQRKYRVADREYFVSNEKKYLAAVSACIGICLVLGYLAEPTHYLSFGCMETLKDKVALEEYAADFWENVEIFNTGENNLTVNSLDNIPDFIEAKETEVWHSGVKLFYQFDGLDFK